MQPPLIIWGKAVRTGTIAFLLFLTVVAAWVGLGWRLVSAQAETPEPTPRMPPMPLRLTPPPTIYPPSPVGQGSQVYYQVCMVCHGDRGQGLTDEWRSVLDEPDQNCWQPKCHGPRHPPWGFEFPKVVPAVASPGMLARFPTGFDLYTFIKQKMPYQAPGSLKDEEYWQLTAYLLQLNGIDPGQELLTPESSAKIVLRQVDQPAEPALVQSPWYWLFGAGVLAAVILLAGAAWAGHFRKPK